MAKNKNLFFTSDQITQNLSKKKRLIGWIILYSVIVLIFISFISNKVSQINTKVIPSGLITLSLPKSQYSLGEGIQLTVTNKLTNTINLNNQCPQEPLNVYRWENNIWSSLHTTVDSAQCQGLPQIISIKPNTTYSIDYSKWNNLFTTPGIYRIAALANNYKSLAYVDFNIISPAQTTKTITNTQTIYKNVYIPVNVNSNGGSTPAPSVNNPTCPSGYSGTYPNCVAPTCPSGQTGTPPNCKTTTRPVNNDN